MLAQQQQHQQQQPPPSHSSSSVDLSALPLLDNAYACQSCFAPLKLASSLVDVDAAILRDDYLSSCASLDDLFAVSLSHDSLLPAPTSAAAAGAAADGSRSLSRARSALVARSRALAPLPSSAIGPMSPSSSSSSPLSAIEDAARSPLAVHESPLVELPRSGRNARALPSSSPPDSDADGGSPTDADDRPPPATPISVASAAQKKPPLHAAASVMNVTTTTTRGAAPMASSLVDERMRSGAPSTGESLDARGVRVVVERVLSLCEHAAPRLAFPLCQICAKRTLDSLLPQLNRANSETFERLQVSQLIESEVSRFERDRVDLAALQRRCVELRATEANMLAELEELARADAALVVEEARVDAAERALQRLERVHALECEALAAERGTVASRFARASVALKRADARTDELVSASVFNDAFYIWHAGHFATINGHRIGRLPSQPVEWRELNAAFGAAAAAVALLRRALGARFRDGRRLLGGGSYALVTDSSGNEMELYGSSDLSLSRLFWYRRFDNGLVAFLQCIADLELHCQTLDASFKLPYPIRGDKIADISIKTKLGNDETWTRALKFLATDLKWLLLFCSGKCE